MDDHTELFFPVYPLEIFTAAVTAVDPFLVNLTISTDLKCLTIFCTFNSTIEGNVRLFP